MTKPWQRFSIFRCFRKIRRKCFICKGGCFSGAETEKFIFWRDSPAQPGVSKVQGLMVRGTIWVEG